MKLKKPENQNYSAIVVELNRFVDLENCDNVKAAIIMGNQVIVSKDTQEGEIGVYFPVESQLSHEFVSNNNLYRHSDNNVDINKRGYFEDNRRVRCVKFRGNKSEGMYIPLESLKFVLGDKIKELKVGDEFDELEGVNICKKYVIKKKESNPTSKKNKGKKAKESKIIENQFRFHDDTVQLYRNLHKVNLDDYISISYKIHGTSSISSKVLCKKKLNIVEKALKTLGVNIVDKQYDNLYASRRVIKNEDLNPQAEHYYGEDIWGLANERLKDVLLDGMTIYYEIVGFTPTGTPIQKGFDYGCRDGHFEIYVYRITFTNPSGNVFEFSFKQMEEWCKSRDIKTVPLLFYGTVKDLFIKNHKEIPEDDRDWRDTFLQILKDNYNEKNCYMCLNPVPEEGCVVRIEKLDFEGYKCKSERFYNWETKMLDKGESDIESEN
jgi:hypothetical protein